MSRYSLRLTLLGSLTHTMFAISSLSSTTIAAEDLEKRVDPKVAAVSLFKNGLAVVHLEIPIDGAGTYLIDSVSAPVHGTMLVQSGGPVETRVENRMLPAEKAPPLGFNLQDELVGMSVTITRRNSSEPIRGVVLQMPKPTPDEPPLNASLRSTYVSPPPVSRFLLLQRVTGLVYVDLNDIVALETDGQPNPERPLQSKLVMLIRVGQETVSKQLKNSSSDANVVRVSYLSHGLAWAPSYHIDLLDDKRLTIEQNAVLKNELIDLQDSKVSLISGYPNVLFSRVISPLAVSQTWDQFFAQLSNHSMDNRLTNSMVSQSVAYNSRGADQSGPSVAPNTGDTLDLYYHSIGNRSLKKGDALALTTASTSSQFKRVVDWTIPDNRDEFGHPTNNRRTDATTGEQLQDDVWDALKFNNPLPFPMTSAPVMVTTGDKFNGQSQVLWTNKNEEATIHVNKALSIRANQTEFENQVDEQGQSARETINLGGRRFRRVTVNGELRLCNNRDTDANMIIKRRFSGDLISSDATPKVQLREEGVWSVNKRNELNWQFTLKPAEERTIKYQYSVLVSF